MPVVVVVVAAVVAGLVTGLFVHRFPTHDPAAPHLAEEKIIHAVAPRERTFFQTRIDPTTLTGLLLTAALVIAVGAAIAIGALFVMAQHNALIARYDLSAARFGADHASATSTRVLRDISLLGGTPAMLVIAIVVGIVEALRSRTRAVLWFVLLVVVGAVVLMNLTKYIVDRPRPDIAQLTGFSGSSFPSGHSVFAAATFASAAFLIGRGRSTTIKSMLAGFAIAIAVAVATTRVMLGVHWLTDVLAGLALGWGWFALCSIAFGGRFLRFGEPVEVAEVAASISP